MDAMQVIEFLKQLLVLVWAVSGVKFIVSHTVLNTVVAVAAAAKTGTLELGRLGEFLGKKVLPYVGIYYTVMLLGESAGLAGLGPVVFGIIEASLAGDLMDSLGQLGINWPGAVNAVVTKDKGC